MKEVIIYGLVAFSSLTMLAFTVHMFLGGLVDERTETLTMVAVTLIGAIVMAFLVWDVLRRRKGRKS